MGSGNFPKLNSRQKAAKSMRRAFGKAEDDEAPAPPAASTKADSVAELNRQHEERMKRRAQVAHTRLDEEQETKKRGKS